MGMYIDKTGSNDQSGYINYTIGLVIRNLANIHDEAIIDSNITRIRFISISRSNEAPFQDQFKPEIFTRLTSQNHQQNCECKTSFYLNLHKHDRYTT